MSKTKKGTKVYIIKRGIDYMLKTLQGRYLAKDSLKKGTPIFTTKGSLAIKRLDEKSILDIVKVFSLRAVKTKKVEKKR
jgi:hypothetical protein